MPQLNYTDHRRELHRNKYVYAVVSRRAGGLSIGVNLNPDKICNFDCPYCQVDRKVPGGNRDVDVQLLADELTHLLTLFHDGEIWSLSPFDTAAQEHRNLCDISIAGDGEPTACPQFSLSVDAILEVRRSFGLHTVPVRLFSNATLFHREKVWRPMSSFFEAGGEVWAKLDAGTSDWFARVDGTAFPFSQVLQNLSLLSAHHPLVLQCMFHRFGLEGPSKNEIQAWCERIRGILCAGGTIRLIQVYSIARAPSDPQVRVLETPELESIASAARRVVAAFPHASTAVHVYPGISPTGVAGN